MLAALTQLPDKLAFSNASQINAVIASQCAHWRGNPPVRGEMYRIVPESVEVATIFGGNRYLAPFYRGIATTSVRTGLAMTGNLERSDKHQFAGQLRQGSKHFFCFIPLRRVWHRVRGGCPTIPLQTGFFSDIMRR